MKESRRKVEFKKNGVKLAILPVITILLELLPYGAVLKFAEQLEDGSITTFKETFSYFSLTPFGYGSFAPLITAILSCALLLFVLIYVLTDRFAVVIVVVSIIAFITSLTPLMLGISYFSVLGLVISILLAIETYFIGKML